LERDFAQKKVFVPANEPQIDKIFLVFLKLEQFDAVLRTSVVNCRKRKDFAAVCSFRAIGRPFPARVEVEIFAICRIGFEEL
jgi:hypothetical protein